MANHYVENLTFKILTNCSYLNTKLSVKICIYYLWTLCVYLNPGVILKVGGKYVYNTVDIFLWHYSLMNPTKNTLKAGIYCSTMNWCKNP